MKTKTYKLKQSDFSIFKRSCIYWSKFFGLSEYDKSYEFSDEGDARATCGANVEAMQAWLTLSTKWETTPTVKSVKLAGFHEVCELLLWKFSAIASAFCADHLVDAERHTIINKLQNAVFTEKGY